MKRCLCAIAALLLTAACHDEPAPGEPAGGEPVLNEGSRDTDDILEGISDKLDEIKEDLEFITNSRREAV